jgi:hypothetical protein
VQTATRVLRVLAAALGLVALGTALADSTGSFGNFASYFTIESNVLAVVVLLVGGLADPRSTRWAYVRGAVTLYMTITMIVYAVLLADVDVQLQKQWVNDSLHRWVPLLLLLDWVVRPPWPAVSRRAALGWLAFPLAYFAYSLLRGPVVDWYPYPFLDPRPHGYDHVVGQALVLAAGMALLALAVHEIGRRRQRTTSLPSSTA